MRAVCETEPVKPSAVPHSAEGVLPSEEQLNAGEAGAVRDASQDGSVSDCVVTSITSS